jgi:hypothetical protein
MKTIALVMACGILFTINLNGQMNSDRDLFKGKNIDSLKIEPYLYNQSPGKLFKKYDLPDDILINPDQNLEGKHFNMESPEIRDSYDKMFAEKFPGSDRFYAKRGMPMGPADRFFIYKPDKGSKYYLIIKDPVTNKITK